MKRQARLLALVEHLRARRTGVTADQLAERFGTTARTIYRDLDALRDASLPLKADRGRGGGYALDKAYTLPPVNFTAREAAVLLTVGRWATELRLMPFSETLASGLDKVRGALTTTAQRELIDLMKGLVFIGIPAHAAKPEVRAAVEQAWFERAALKMRYQHTDGRISEETVQVDGVLMERSALYLRGSGRTWRLDRVVWARAV